MTTVGTAATLPVTCASAPFQALKGPDDVCNPYFDTKKAFWRAIKVFVASYPELTPNSPQIYKRKFNEYMSEMKRVYNIQNVDMRVMSDITKEIKAEKYGIIVFPKRLKTPDQTNRPVFVATVLKNRVERNLDQTKEIQAYAPIRLLYSFDNFLKLRTDSSQKLRITVQTDEWTQQGYEPPNFEITLAEIHPEGYEDWLDFGRGVQVLIGIEYKIPNERNITTEEVSQFHFETIIRMLERRLRQYNQKTRSIDIGHKVFAMKSKVTHRRTTVRPETEEMFFSTSIPTKHPKRVKFFELQIGYESAEDFTDSVCLCSEWCNWNAFFYYNPIYRFLLIQHTQLYMKNRSNVPEFYLCSATLKACYRGTAGKSPLLLLMISANDCRQRYQENYLFKNPKYLTEYQSAIPIPHQLNAVSYNAIRYKLDIAKRCHEFNADLFSDLCIELMKSYFKMLTDLHTFHSYNPAYVPDREEWYDEMDCLSRQHYGEYIKRAYVLCISYIPGGYDYLFGVDYEYVDRIAQGVGTVLVKSIRDNVTKKTSTDNPMNFKVISNDFLNMFISVYKFLAKVESKLSVAYRPVGRREIYDCYKRFDADCEQYLRAHKTFNYHFENMDIKHLPIFYTLKLYSYLFEIQRHCINSSLNYTSNKEQVSTSFNFIWRHTLIEQKYRTKYPGDKLFEISPQIEHTFNEFYERFWGRPRHEISMSGNIVDYINSGLFQYQKLYFWMKNNGNQRKKFTKILDAFKDSLSDVVNRSERILNQWICTAIHTLSLNYAYDLEVFDYLVYYLVKADCSMILSTTATFFKSMHSLQTQITVDNNISYVMSKPGWVQLFRTLDSVLETIDRIKVKYIIIFDDELNRISNTCDQTKQMIKDIYRSFYMKLVYEWIRELQHLWVKRPIYPNLTLFALLHMAVGSAFLSHFFNHFRKHFDKFRKNLFFILRKPPNPNKDHQLKMSMARNAINDYLQDKALIQEADPFRANTWIAHMFSHIAILDQMTGQQLNIDMTEADT